MSRYITPSSNRISVHFQYDKQSMGKSIQCPTMEITISIYKIAGMLETDNVKLSSSDLHC
jgi:hypothetical protein